MSASLWMPVVAGAALFVAVFAAGVIVGGFALWRYGRRRWRALRSHGLVVGGLALWEATSALRERWGSPMPATDVTSWEPRQARREIRRAVGRAERAVRAADDVGASTTGLPLLCTRLRSAAAALDTVLRIEPSGAMPSEIRGQVADVLRAAADVQEAAVSSASDVNGQRVRVLALDADYELRCLDAGLASARATFPDLQR